MQRKGACDTPPRPPRARRAAPGYLVRVWVRARVRVRVRVRIRVRVTVRVRVRVRIR